MFLLIEGLRHRFSLDFRDKGVFLEIILFLFKVVPGKSTKLYDVDKILACDLFPAAIFFNPGVKSKMFGIAEHNNTWWVLTAKGGELGIILLDETMVGVALPTLQRDFGMTQIAAN